MEKPAILTVDDEAGVLHAVSRDLLRRYGSGYRVLQASSGREALEALRQLRLRNDPVALLLVDQRMPGMTGVEFLGEAMALYPDAKRVLLTAYADTEAAIRAINDVDLDHYLMKPWDPPEDQLYPVLSDLLDDWRASFLPPFEGIRIIGHRWSPETHAIKDYLARNQVPYQWLDIELDDEAGQLLQEAGSDPDRLPAVIFDDGAFVSQPSIIQIAEKIGRRTRPALPFYDLIIVGAGPAGLAAAVYGASEGLRTVLIEREAPGGQAGTTSRIENYLGFPSGLSGSDLARRAVAQAQRLGAEIIMGEVCSVRLDGPYRIVELAGDGEISCHALLISAGVSYRKLEAPGIDRLTGKGVYYGGALAEAMALRDEDVFIVGGANSAGQAAIHFSRYCRSVTMVVRGSSLAKSSMSRYLVEQIEASENIDVWLNSNVVEAHGEKRLEAITVDRNGVIGDPISTNALFIFIGARPYTEWISHLVALDPSRHILAGEDFARRGRAPDGWPLRRSPFPLETSVPGIFVAGDVRHRSLKRIASATGEGAMAVHFVHQYLSSL